MVGTFLSTQLSPCGSPQLDWLWGEGEVWEFTDPFGGRARALEDIFPIFNLDERTGHRQRRKSPMEDA